MHFALYTLINVYDFEIIEFNNNLCSNKNVIEIVFKREIIK